MQKDEQKKEAEKRWITFFEVEVKSEIEIKQVKVKSPFLRSEITLSGAMQERGN